MGKVVLSQRRKINLNINRALLKKTKIGLSQGLLQGSLLKVLKTKKTSFKDLCKVEINNDNKDGDN